MIRQYRGRLSDEDVRLILEALTMLEASGRYHRDIIRTLYDRMMAIFADGTTGTLL